MTQTHADRITALARLIMTDPAHQSGPFPDQDLREAVAMIPRLIEQDLAAKRRDHKRDLRRRLPEDARALVTIPDAIDRVLDRMMACGGTGSQRLISVDDCQELASYAAVLRGIAERLAEKE